MTETETYETEEHPPIPRWATTAATPVPPGWRAWAIDGTPTELPVALVQELRGWDTWPGPAVDELLDADVNIPAPKPPATRTVLGQVNTQHGGAITPTGPDTIAITSPGEDPNPDDRERIRAYRKDHTA